MISIRKLVLQAFYSRSDHLAQQPNSDYWSFAIDAILVYFQNTRQTKSIYIPYFWSRPAMDFEIIIHDMLNQWWNDELDATTTL